MSRPGSSAQSIGGYDESRPMFARPQSKGYYASSLPLDAMTGWEMGQGGAVNGMAEGRVVYPMPGGVAIMASSGMPRRIPDDQDEEDFLPIQEGNYAYTQITPYHSQHHVQHPPHPTSIPAHYMHGATPYHMVGPSHISPTAMMGQHGYPMMHVHSQSPTDGMYVQSAPMGHHQHPGPPPRRHTSSRGSITAASRPSMGQRQYSLQPPPARAGDASSQDVFVMPPASTPVRHVPGHGEFQLDGGQYYTLPQGISPARALGPAPTQRSALSPPADPLNTPQTKIPSLITPSSLASTVRTENSSDSEYSPPDRVAAASDDEDVYSPTKPTKKLVLERTLEPAPRRQNIPAIKLKGVIGGRTSAKFAKVAEDPGVEGVPPGPRPLERPAPSFACIIGQAILKCSAGGLSLEHIYRYVETAYPFFKTDNSAWRNSVRHNLSIHKMFETIPRTEHFPPGKGGIWIIHEEEKIHWPAEDKFIKNFPQNHAHHAVCRQTLHERAKELEQMAKAKAEGREYVPKKGKKARKVVDDFTPEPTRAASVMSDAPGPSNYMHAGPSVLAPMVPPPPPKPMPLPLQRPDPTPEPEATPPKVAQKILHPPPFYRNLSSSMAPHPAPQPLFVADDAMPKTMVPPRFGSKRPLDGDEENVFTAPPKRVRVKEPQPLAPLPQESLDDHYITPERERQLHKAMPMGSAFKTPGLVNSASSPSSSPMPPTVQRTAQHHPSGLQQTWTEEDDEDMSPPPAFALDAAFEVKPKTKPAHLRSLDAESSQTSLAFAMPSVPSPRQPPKTPLTRSSAAGDRVQMAHRTPSIGKTPILSPDNIGDIPSTPMWEIQGILSRLTGLKAASQAEGVAAPYISTPTSFAGLSLPLGLRSPITSTDPGRNLSTLYGSMVPPSPSKLSYSAMASGLTVADLQGTSPDSTPPSPFFPLPSPSMMEQPAPEVDSGDVVATYDIIEKALTGRELGMRFDREGGY